MLVKILPTILILLQLHTSRVLTQVCTSVDDPHMSTFDGTNHEFHYDGAHYILYTDFKETRITAGYQQCVSWSNARCNCAVYVKKGDTIAFIDFCRVNEYKRPFDRFYTVSKTAEGTYGPQAIKPITCSPMLPSQEFDEQAWNNIFAANQFFKCAKIGDGSFVTYVVRTYDPRAPGEAVKIKVDVGPLQMPRIYVTPSANSFKNTGGLCGMWNNDRNKDLYVLDSNLVPKYTNNAAELKEFWRLDSKWSPNVNRCPECFLQAERRLYCPCDTIPFQDAGDAYCSIPMPTCIEKSLNLPVSPVSNFTTPAPPTVSPTSTVSPPITTTGITYEQALAICTNAIMNHPGLKPLIESGLYNPANAIHNCVQDLLLTNELEFVNLHIELAIIEVQQNILQNATNIINGTIVPPAINILLNLCPGNCNGNGQCMIKPECLIPSEIKNPNVLANCLLPVFCQCKPNFGGPNCATNIQDVPDFFLSKTCCDIRNYDCDTISGFGYPFARKTKLYYKIIFSETDNTNIFDNVLNGLAEIVSDNEFTIDLPLNTLWRQNTSVVDVSIGISYDENKFKYQKLQLYDSICRECDGEVSNEYIMPETCLIDNKCYTDGQEEFNNEDNICDPTNPFEWTFIGYVSPSCNNATHQWSPWYNLDDPSGDGDIEILTLIEDLKCNVADIEVFTVDDIPLEKVKNQNYYKGLDYGFICMNNEQADGNCLDYKIRQCCVTDAVEDCTVAVSLNAGPMLVKENAGTAKVTISLPDNDKCKLTKEMKIDYHTEEHTATSENFVGVAHSVIFSPGDIKKEINIPIKDNNLIEPFKFFTFIIDKASIDNYIIQNNELVIYIQDDDYDKPGAITGPVFDILKRSHAEIFTNMAILDQIVPDPYDVCPGYGGLTSENEVMEIFFEFLDNYYDLYTVEVNNPKVCNLKHLVGYLMDRFGNALSNEALDSIQVEDELFIDIKYLTHYTKPKAKNDAVEAILVSFDETKDGKNPTACELRMFGRANGKKPPRKLKSRKNF